MPIAQGEIETTGEQPNGITRRQLLQGAAAGAAMLIVGVPKPELQPVDLLNLIPAVKGFGENGSLQTGVFCLNWGSLDGRSGRRETAFSKRRMGKNS